MKQQLNILRLFYMYSTVFLANSMETNTNTMVVERNTNTARLPMRSLDSTFTAECITNNRNQNVPIIKIDFLLYIRNIRNNLVSVKLLIYIKQQELMNKIQELKQETPCMESICDNMKEISNQITTTNKLSLQNLQNYLENLKGKIICVEQLKNLQEDMEYVKIFMEDEEDDKIDDNHIQMTTGELQQLSLITNTKIFMIAKQVRIHELLLKFFEENEKYKEQENYTITNLKNKVEKLQKKILLINDRVDRICKAKNTRIPLQIKKIQKCQGNIPETKLYIERLTKDLSYLSKQENLPFQQMIKIMELKTHKEKLENHLENSEKRKKELDDLKIKLEEDLANYNANIVKISNEIQQSINDFAKSGREDNKKHTKNIELKTKKIKENKNLIENTENKILQTQKELHNLVREVYE
jgi:hypothetical protein